MLETDLTVCLGKAKAVEAPKTTVETKAVAVPKPTEQATTAEEQQPTVEASSFCLDVKTSKLAITVEKNRRDKQAGLHHRGKTPPQHRRKLARAPTLTPTAMTADSRTSQIAITNRSHAQRRRPAQTCRSPFGKRGITSFIPVRIAQNFSLAFTRIRRISSQSP